MGSISSKDDFRRCSVKEVAEGIIEFYNEHKEEKVNELMVGQSLWLYTGTDSTKHTEFNFRL